MQITKNNPARPQVKICGLTRPDEAHRCAAMGANAIGLVFYPPSPRNVLPQQARDICRQLPHETSPVGVFVDMPPEEILALASGCGFTTVQLHGRETPGQIDRLDRAGLKVVKALFVDKKPYLTAAPDYEAASAFLVECGRGKLPGGNALTWNWALPEDFAARYPVILAGGLGPENVRNALLAGRPDALDVSSGVETAPGKKDLGKVQAFINAAKDVGGKNRSAGCRPLKRIF